MFHCPNLRIDRGDRPKWAHIRKDPTSITSTSVATRPCQTRRDGVEGKGLRVLESRRSRMTRGTWRRSTVDVHKILKGSKVWTS
jgi:hypothetical protein